MTERERLIAEIEAWLSSTTEVLGLMMPRALLTRCRAALEATAVPRSMFLPWTPEDTARRFHEAYESLAPSFGYKTREASAKPWADVPQQNRDLMIAVVRQVFIEQIYDAALQSSESKGGM